MEPGNAAYLAESKLAILARTEKITLNNPRELMVLVEVDQLLFRRCWRGSGRRVALSTEREVREVQTWCMSSNFNTAGSRLLTEERDCRRARIP